MLSIDRAPHTSPLPLLPYRRASKKVAEQAVALSPDSQPQAKPRMRRITRRGASVAPRFGVDAQIPLAGMRIGAERKLARKLRQILNVPISVRQFRLTHEEIRPAPNAVRKVAHAIWLHAPTGPAGAESTGMKSADLSSLLRFARKNRTWTVTLHTDDPARIRRRLTQAGRKLIKVQEYHQGLPDDFHVARQYIDVMLKHAPAAAKDLLSYLIQFENPGLVLTTSINSKKKALPAQLAFPGLVAVNNFDLRSFTVQHSPYAMKILLSLCERMINKFYDRTLHDNAEVSFTVKPEYAADAAAIPERVSYELYVWTLNVLKATDISGSVFARPVKADAHAIDEKPVPSSVSGPSLSLGDGIRCNRPGLPVPRNAHFFWFHKNDSPSGDLGRTINETEIDHIREFKKLNPDWNVTLWSDDVARVREALGPNRSGLHVSDFHDIFAGGSRGVAGEYVHALKQYVPAYAKDICVPAVLEKYGGIASDVDIDWTGPIPEDFTLANPIHLISDFHDPYRHDVQIIAHALSDDPNASNAMSSVMDNIEKNIQTYHKRIVTKDGGVVFRPRRKGDVDYVVPYAFGFEPVVQPATEASNDSYLNEHLAFNSFGSAYGWQKQGAEIGTLTSPNLLEPAGSRLTKDVVT